jgi:hypothetical protein
VVFEIAKRYPQTEVVGIKNALFPYALAKM